MDSITHIALGACVGELLLGKQLGKKALIWGVIAQNLPDIDSFGVLFFPADQALLAHRGITHSLLFALVVGVFLAFLAKKIHYKIYLPFALLVFFFCFQLALHDLLDCCNSYGTGLLEPFSHHRFSINMLFVADPFFTISLVVAAVLLIFKNSANKNRAKWAYTGIAVSAVYLCFAGFSKMYTDARVQASFNDQKIHPTKYFTTPAPFNCMLWYVAADAYGCYYTGYSSIWDNKRQPVTYRLQPKHYDLLKDAPDQQVVQNLITFADNFYTASKKGDTTYFNILRFQQIHGWQHPDAAFVLSYPLLTGNNQQAELQKGRMAGWNKKSVRIYIDRIFGKKN